MNMKKMMICRVGALAVVAAVLSACATAPVQQALEPVETEVEKVTRIARKTAELPRVMLLVDEKSLGTVPTAEVEAMAIKMLLAENVKVVDQDMVQSNLGKGSELLKMAGDNRGAAALGLQFGADIVLVGEVVAKPSARRIGDSNLRTYQAAATLRAIRTDNSAAIASASEDASIIGLDDVSGSAKAIKTAGGKSLDILIPAMLDAWTGAGGRSAVRVNQVTLTIGGVDQLWKVKAIRDQLRGMNPHIVNVVQRNYTAGVAVFELDALLPIEELSEAIVMAPPEDLSFQVLDIGAGNINLRVAVP